MMVLLPEALVLLQMDCIGASRQQVTSSQLVVFHACLAKLLVVLIGRGNNRDNLMSSKYIQSTTEYSIYSDTAQLQYCMYYLVLRCEVDAAILYYLAYTSND